MSVEESPANPARMSVEESVASAYPAAGHLRVIGRGTNPARFSAATFADDQHAYRIDSIAESEAEVRLQVKHMKPLLHSQVHSRFDSLASALHEWKHSVAKYVQDHPTPTVVNVEDCRATATHFVTQMELAKCTVAEELDGSTVSAGAVSLRQVLLEWIVALAHVEEALGLTYVDAHLGNFALFEDGQTSVRKLIDLESLQPLRLAFVDSTDSHTCQNYPSIPHAYEDFLRGYGDPANRHTLQQFFVQVMVNKLERSLVCELRDVYLARARMALSAADIASRELTGDSVDDLAKVERFISEVAEPAICDLRHGAIRPHGFYTALLRRAGGTQGLLAAASGSSTVVAALDMSTCIAASEAASDSRVLRIHPGDVAKLIIIALCLIFLGSVVLHDLGLLNAFSRSYLEDGFCVSNSESLLWSSHAISFYANTLTALGMAFLVCHARRSGLGEPAIAPLMKNSLSLFGHGIGHLFLAVHTSSGSSSDSSSSGSGAISEEHSPVARFIMFVAFFPVWFAFMTDRRRSLVATLGFTLCHDALQTYLLPQRFFFTHVLMAVLLGSAVRWIGRPRAEKNRYYALEAWLVDVPILLAAFGEALTCDGFLVRFGGHVWFDMVVPIGFTMYYFILVNDPRERIWPHRRAAVKLPPAEIAQRVELKAKLMKCSHNATLIKRQISGG